MTSLTWDQILRFRSARHFLTQRAAHDRLLEVISELGGIEAQVMSAGELQLWARVDGLKLGELDDLLWKDRSLVKTWAMRGAIHLLTAEDLPVYVAAMRVTRNAHRKQYWLKNSDTDLEEVEAIITAIPKVLDGQTLTREALAEGIVAAAKVPRQRDRLRSGWGEFLKLGSYQGHLIFGPSQGQNDTFVRPDQWLANWREVEPDEAMRIIARRYFSAFGPSPLEAFAQWWDVQGGDGRHWFKLMQDELVEVDVEGWKGLLLAKDVAVIESLPDESFVRLLPNFDTFTIMAYHERELLLSADLLPRIYRKAGWISPVILVNGRIQGVWKYEQKRARIQVSIEPFADLSAPVKEQIEAEATRFGEFLGAPAEITFQPTG